VLILRVKRCELALAGGRLDEAHQLLAAADLRAHRRGQELLDRLLAAFVVRGREHLAAGRIAAADDDCRKAISLGGNTQDAARLRAEIDAASATERQELARRQHVAAAARQLVHHGDFTQGQAYAARALAAGDAGAEELIADITDRRLSFERCLADASAAIARHDWDAAVPLLSRAATLRPAASESHSLARDIAQRVTDDTRQLIETGRLSEAELLLRRVARLPGSHFELKQNETHLAQCRRAWELFSQGRQAEASEILARLRHVWPRAQWIEQAVSAMAEAGAANAAVRCGPLGMLDDQLTIAMPPPSPAPAPVAPPVISQFVARAQRRFLLHVDGAGSYLVIQNDVIEVGPVRASRPPDVPLLTSPCAPTITLSRSEEDYFLNSPRSPVAVNDRMVSSALLTGGDRISLGSRCRIEFRRLNAASASASLHISGARLPWGGVQAVLLMDRELIIGPLASAHVRTRDSTEQLVLQAGGDGTLLGRASERIALDGRPGDRITPIALGARVTVGNLSLVVTTA
jgi:hypothetical protein